MSSGGMPSPAGGRWADESPLASPVAYNEATANRALTAALAGTSVAILTFVLFFLYPRWSSGEISDLGFEATVLTILGGLFLISLASMNFWFVMEAVRSNHPHPEKYLRRAEAFFSIGWLFLIFEPALILFTIRLNYAALVALALWVVVIASMAFGWKDARRWSE